MLITQQGIQGFLYDGQQSGSQKVVLFVDSSGMVSLGEQRESCCQFSALTISPRVGNSARHLQLPDGRRFETRNNDGIDQLCHSLLSRQQAKRQGLAHRLESNLKLVTFSLIALIGISYITVVFGIPLISKQITDWLPYQIDERIAKHSLPQLDSMIFKPTTLNPEKQQQLTQLFQQLLPSKELVDHPRQFRLLFRDGNQVGANAFALPDGTIVITDQLIQLATNDEMIASILLHEIGHVEHRHSVQNLVRQAGLSALIVVITGDINSASSLVLLLPNLLMQAQYSQEFEWQADSYALDQMLRKNMDPNNFSLIMAQMARQKKPNKTGDNAPATNDDNDLTDETNSQTKTINLSDYLSSHPASAKRIQRFKNAAKALDNKHQKNSDNLKPHI